MVRSKLASQSSNNLMTERLRHFLKHKVDSFVKWDLLRFFHDNPQARDTAENIARYIGRDILSFEQELGDLVETGVLVADEVSGRKIYRLTNEENVRNVVHQFMEACHDRRFRVEAIHYVIHGMQDVASQRNH